MKDQKTTVDPLDKKLCGAALLLALGLAIAGSSSVSPRIATGCFVSAAGLSLLALFHYLKMRAKKAVDPDAEA